jgi:NADH-quinone oxidoreductase subunit H
MLALRLAALILCLFVVAGCATSGDAPDLLDVIDVAPREVDVGDRIEVLGTNLPAGSAKDATVTFTGELRRPGAAPIERQEITVPRAQLASDKITLGVTEAIQARFCGRGDDAIHTTFRGDVTVTIPSSMPGRLPVKGTVKGVTLDLRAPAPRRAIAEARDKEGRRALAHLGLALAADAPTSGGVVVVGVSPDSPASAAQILPGDVIERLDGVKVDGAADLVPGGRERRPAIDLRRGGERLAPRPISFETYELRAPADLIAAGVILVSAAALLFVFMTPTAGLLVWIERRLAAKIPRRLAPARCLSTSPPGFIAFVITGVRSSFREDLALRDGEALLSRLAPYLVFVGVSSTFAVMPFGQRLVAADLDVVVLFLLAVTSLVTIGFLTGGAGHPGGRGWSLRGGLCAAAQVATYEIPAAVAIACLVVMTGSLRLEDIIAAQTGPGGAPLLEGGLPWHWYLFRSPVTFALFFLYVSAALAEGTRAPFDLPAASFEPAASAPAAGTGVRHLLFFFAEWANVFVMSGVGSALFLGGWQLPFVSPAAQEAHLALEVAGALLFLVKSWALVFAIVWARWALPRLRLDQMTSLCLRWFVPLSILALLITGLWVVAPLDRTAQVVTSLATFVASCALLVHFVRRVQYNLRTAKVQTLRLNPFL